MSIRIELHDEGFTVIADDPVGGEQKERWYQLIYAAGRIVPSPLHPDSLQRRWRHSAKSAKTTDRIGVKLGRGVYFTADDIAKLGYTISEENNQCK
tara:strand:+ start:457 stop:744 length:288 start_codon:yes stop_codon:yes gene_type:complete